MGFNFIILSTYFRTAQKENIKPTTFSLDDVLKLEVVDYNMIGAPKTELKTGFIAQDLHKVYPEVVSVGGEDVNEKPWMVSYGNLTPLLVKSVQELDELNKTQAKTILSLEDRISKLESLVQKLSKD